VDINLDQAIPGFALDIVYVKPSLALHIPCIKPSLAYSRYYLIASSHRWLTQDII